MSTLFGSSGLFGNTGGTTSILAEWASIKSGNYKRLMRAYYSQDSNTTSKTKSSSTKTKQEERAVTEAESSAQGLKKATDDLLATGNKSVFKKVDTKDADGKVTQEYDTNKIYNAVNKFVQNYNEVIKNTADTINSGVSSNRRSMISATDAKEKFLNDIGITINADNTLSIDKEAFQKADMSKVETMFSGNTSYGYQVSMRSSLIDYHAGREADTYNRYGGYNTYKSGVNFDSLL